jgi:hypothetical protein
MLPDFFRHYPDPPANMTVGAAVARVLDGLGMRLYIALDGLTETNCEYRVCEGAMSIGEIIGHQWGLVNWIHEMTWQRSLSRPSSRLEQGAMALDEIGNLRQLFAEMSDEEFEALQFGDQPFWCALNKPISDLLHHTGQVAHLRRAAGNPV